MQKIINGQDMLREVHAAAEELQMKIDRKSYLLVNTQSWEPERRPKLLQDQENLIEFERNDSKDKVTNSLIETVLDLGSDHHGSNASPSESMSKKPQSWPSHISFHSNMPINEQEDRTLESASSLSLATFSSLLIEFVARLQYLIDSYELSKLANFKEAEEPNVLPQDAGL